MSLQTKVFADDVLFSENNMDDDDDGDVWCIGDGNSINELDQGSVNVWSVNSYSKCNCSVL